MNWIQKLERKFGRYAINNLMYYIIILYIGGYLIDMLNPGFFDTYLSLNVEEILHGQVWRLVTFLAQPMETSIIFLAFALYLYYMIGQHLEAEWGAFRFNLYFFSGVLFHIIAGFVVYFATGISMPIGTTYLNLSLFFAFAALYPNVEFLLFFIIPVKVKYLALLDGIFFGYTILQAFMPAYGGNPYIGVVLSGKSHCGGCITFELCDFLFFVEKLQSIFAEAVSQKEKISKRSQKCPCKQSGCSRRCEA